MNLLQIERALKANKERIERLTSEFEREMKRCEEERKELLRLKTLCMQGIDMDKVSLAEKILVFSKGFKRFNPNVIRKAIDDIASGQDRLKTEYFGTKDYECFVNQEMSCEYGMEPKHGVVVFSVGFSSYARKNGLNDNERNACLYYLNLLLDSEDFRKNAKVS